MVLKGEQGELIIGEHLAGKFTKPADTGNTRPVDLGGAKSGKVVLKGQSKNLVALQHIQYITGI